MLAQALTVGQGFLLGIAIALLVLGVVLIVMAYKIIWDSHRVGRRDD